MSIENDRENLERNLITLHQSAGELRNRAVNKLGYSLITTTLGAGVVENMLTDNDTKIRIISGVVGVIALYGGLRFGKAALEGMESYSSVNEMIAVDEYKMDQLPKVDN